VSQVMGEPVGLPPAHVLALVAARQVMSPAAS
jgi:hypothetical protein